jgi:2-deoxy-D-gluconate 3-dehydrogenase
MVAIVEPTGESLAQLLDLTNKSAVVTGGAMGIGYAIARRLAEAGARVTITDVNPEAAAASATRLSHQGRTAHALQGDVRSAADVQPDG